MIVLYISIFLLIEFIVGGIIGCILIEESTSKIVIHIRDNVDKNLFYILLFWILPKLTLIVIYCILKCLSAPFIFLVSIGRISNYKIIRKNDEYIIKIKKGFLWTKHKTGYNMCSGESAYKKILELKSEHERKKVNKLVIEIADPSIEHMEELVNQGLI